MTELRGARAVLGTKHGKEAVIAPILGAELGLEVDVVDSLDTDRFGTFTREVPRTKGPRETARAKAFAALEAHGSASFAIASEGSFGPHPVVPFAACGRELVILVDRASGLELVGADLTTDTNFGAREVASLGEALAFAEKASFPSHALIVMGARGGDPLVGSTITKAIVAARVLEEAVAEALRAHGRAWVETDMRAHLNPTRMRGIARATEDLVRAARSRCPACARPGFVVVERIGGLPCEECGEPTRRVRAEVLACAGCGQREERQPEGAPERASPFHCDVCNP